MYPLTLFSSTAKVFIASCILSKLVDFQTKSAAKLWVQSVGTPSDRRNSNPISSETSAKRFVQQDMKRGTNRLTIRNLDDVSNTFPRFMHLALIPQPELISNGQPNFSTFQLGQTEPCNTLLVQTKVPPNSNITLRLTFLQLLVIISLDFD